MDRHKALLQQMFPAQAPIPKEMDGEPDRSPRPPKRTQRHTNMSREEAKTMVTAVVERWRDHVPTPRIDGGLDPVLTAAERKKNGPKLGRDEATRLALRRAEQVFGIYGTCIPLGSAPDRARKHKPVGFQWTSQMKKKALQEFHVNGKYVAIAPEVSKVERTRCARVNLVYCFGLVFFSRRSFRDQQLQDSRSFASWPDRAQVFYRRAMLLDSRHTVKDASGKPVGVRLMCPYCMSNSHTKLSGGWSAVSLQQYEMKAGLALMCRLQYVVPSRRRLKIVV